MALAAEQLIRLVKTCGLSYIVLFQVDHLKKITDSHGSICGAETLKAVADRVRGAARPQDLFGRHNDEEFILFVSDMDEDGVASYTDRLRRAISSAPVELEGLKATITACFGIASLFPENDLLAAIGHAGGALNVAKRGGRNKVVIQMSRQ
jgi:diguanylate cyclase (GGDEF)-like protein